MNVEDTLESLRHYAQDHPDVVRAILETKNSRNPVGDFCALSTRLGFPLDMMELLSAGEDAYAAMRRSTNGGGENSPLLAGEDDYYELFLARIEKMR